MFEFISNIFKKDTGIADYFYRELSEDEKTSIFFALDGETELQLKNYDKAVEYMNKAIELENSNDMYFVTRALAYKGLGNYKSALDDINKAISLNGKVEKTKAIKKEIQKLMK